MLDSNQTYRKLFAGLLALAAVVTANLIAAEAERDFEAAAVETTEAVPEATRPSIVVPPAPSPISADLIGAPTALGGLETLGELEFIVPDLERPAISLPEIRRIQSPWLGDGVMPAPASVIRVEAPRVEMAAVWRDTEIDVPELERPELPAPPPVR